MPLRNLRSLGCSESLCFHDDPYALYFQTFYASDDGDGDDEVDVYSDVSLHKLLLHNR